MEALRPATHEIVFDHVDFAYVPGEPVLKQASFTVPDQKLTAIVGDSGSGKSTILNLIAKYYEPASGVISIGGKPINHVAAERVLEQVSMVDQDVFLFDDTIRDNIRHARPGASDAEIEAACREANCDGFIRRMEKGYDTPTGENGNLLSGGERQRLSIARAILKDSPICCWTRPRPPWTLRTSWRSSRPSPICSRRKDRGNDRPYPFHRQECGSDPGSGGRNNQGVRHPRGAAGYERQVCGHVERRTENHCINERSRL